METDLPKTEKARKELYLSQPDHRFEFEFTEDALSKRVVIVAGGTGGLGSATVSPATFKAGTIKFGIRNVGTMVHDFDLIKTDIAFDKLPTDVGSGKAKDDGLVKQMINIAANRVTTLSADLAPGNYVIICNVAGHYQLGMRAAFKVE